MALCFGVCGKSTAHRAPFVDLSRALGIRGGSEKGLTLRVRMPDGAVKRVQASPSDTLEDIKARLGEDAIGEGAGLSAGADGDAAEPLTSVAALGLANGDFLFVKVCTSSVCARLDSGVAERVPMERVGGSVVLMYRSARSAGTLGTST